MTDHKPLSRDEEWKYAQTALSWHGWGSPVGFGIGLVAIGIAAALIRIAIVGL